MFDNHMASMSKEEKEAYHFTLKDDNARILLLDIDEKHKKIKSSKSLKLKIKSPYMGSVQKVDPNWFIGCGSSDQCTAMMVNRKADVLWWIKFDSPYKMYRAFYDQNQGKARSK